MSAEHIGSEVKGVAGGGEEKKGETENSIPDKAPSSRHREELNSARSILPPLRETSRARQGTLHNVANSGPPGEGLGGGEGGDTIQVSTNRENTKTEVQSLGLGRKTATLYLSRTHTMMKGRSSSQAVQKPMGKGEGMTSSRCTHRGTTNLSQQKGPGSRTSSVQGHMSAEAEEELLSLVGLQATQREFTFTGYTIEEDVKYGCDYLIRLAFSVPREQTPADLTEGERACREYRNVYVKTCQKLGVLPVAPVTKALGEDHVTLKTRGLGVRGARAIAAALVGNKHVQSLELEDNWIGGDGAASIASMLVGNNVITEVVSPGNCSINSMGLNISRY
ncbi:leucine-rich repeat-containing protein 74A [Elysia marginata]|uniref:Leucine-rich repeat-containing protein 74A n=1 Tax=Elysia marginata TaxID=1093978 RepID=A0AAV4JG50_9GAST|nr:leucine-rich repeat-containing protein 74A [Elysia marginata]